ncbi:hypothetical protein PUNSTDRAFT_29434, partial [Punctularia strigosozonata HHB-11173 SS5]|uniref:uncharacterized protein n=1 Tax=Punctularia strigosozonata (strain HHB-11173) TaxID=741275 RepID=UPI000441722E
EPWHNSILTGQKWVEELLDGHYARMHAVLGMHKHVFLKLGTELEEHVGFTRSKHVSSQESLAIFLY